MIDTLINKLKLQLEDFNALRPHIEQDYTYLSLKCPITKPVLLIPSDSNNCFYLNKPNHGQMLVGLGSLISYQSSGQNRFSALKNKYSSIIKKWFLKDNHAANSVQAFIAFAFDEHDRMSGPWQNFPNTVLTIPEILIRELTSSDGSIIQFLEVNIKLNDKSDANKASYNDIFISIKNKLNQYIRQTEHTKKQIIMQSAVTNSAMTERQYKKNYKTNWKSLTKEAIKQIKYKNYDKLVSSRSYSMIMDKAISITQLVKNLRKHYPSCSIVSYKIENTSIIAASPERLLTLNYPHIESDAIGGTIKKSSKNPFWGNFSENLSLNEKLLKEHQFISHDIYQRLDPLCLNLKMPISPALMMLHNMYHLETLIQGTIKPNYGFFDLIEALHPTPAVAGFPAHKAKRWLVQHEGYNRGWYSGAFGWVDSDFNGELSVMLRCALIKEQKITLFAGAGLVAESDPETEWLETEIKMNTILEQL